MGYYVENVGLARHKENGGTAEDWRYMVGRASPAMHIDSPPMTGTEVRDAIDAAGGTESAWLDAHPSAVKTWLQQQPSGVRAACKAVCASYDVP